MKDFDFKCVTKDKEFKGAIKNYEGANGVVAVGFTTTNAFVMEDEQGLYTLVDIRDNIKNLGMDCALCRESTGIAMADGCDDEEIERLGISKEDAQDIVDTIRELSKMEILDKEE